MTLSLKSISAKFIEPFFVALLVRNLICIDVQSQQTWFCLRRSRRLTFVGVNFTLQASMFLNHFSLYEFDLNCRTISVRFASGKHVRAINTPLNPTFIYKKTGICRDIPIFFIFATKHRLWVLVRTASARRF